MEEKLNLTDVQEKIDFIIARLKTIDDKISDLAMERRQLEDTLYLFLELKENINYEHEERIKQCRNQEEN